MIDIALSCIYAGIVAISAIAGYKLGKSRSKPAEPKNDIREISFGNLILRARSSKFRNNMLFVDCYRKGASDNEKFFSPSVWIGPDGVINE